MHISHTFTHEAEDSATYFDVTREISWNQAWLAQWGLNGAKWFSNSGLIPPAITGLHNGDALRAWSDNGLVNAVGDNTRPMLLNPVSVLKTYMDNANEHRLMNIGLCLPRLQQTTLQAFKSHQDGLQTFTTT